MAKPRLPKTLSDVHLLYTEGGRRHWPVIFVVEDKPVVVFPGYANSIVISVDKRRQERKFYRAIYQVGDSSTDLHQPLSWLECVPVQVTEYIIKTKRTEEYVELSKASSGRSESR